MLKILLTNDIFLIGYVIAFLYIWFDTDALVEWGELFHFKFLKYQEYKESRKGPMAMVVSRTYVDFLLNTYGHAYAGSSIFTQIRAFLIRLITCPVCFSVWVNLVALSVFPKCGGFIMLGVNIIAVWIGYHALKYIMVKLNNE